MENNCQCNPLRLKVLYNSILAKYRNLFLRLTYKYALYQGISGAFLIGCLDITLETTPKATEVLVGGIIIINLNNANTKVALLPESFGIYFTASDTLMFQ